MTTQPTRVVAQKVAKREAATKREATTTIQRPSCRLKTSRILSLLRLRSIFEIIPHMLHEVAFKLLTVIGVLDGLERVEVVVFLCWT